MVSSGYQWLFFFGIFAYSLFISTTAQASPLDGTIWERASQQSDPELLYAIALQESRGVFDGKAKPRPWVIRYEEKVYEPDGFWAAAHKLDELLANGAPPKAIDVGMMQINLGWHGGRVEQPMELLIPAVNISVADKILGAAQASTKDAIVGIGRYHSYTQELARKYGEQVALIACRLKARSNETRGSEGCYERQWEYQQP